jgi:hypothetical protein
MARTTPAITLDEARAELPRAEEALRASTGWEWLFTGRETYNVAMVLEAINKRFGGVYASDDAVRRWFKLLPRTEGYGSNIGLWANRDDLVVLFARRQLGYMAEDDGAEAAD